MVSNKSSSEAAAAPATAAVPVKLVRPKDNREADALDEAVVDDVEDSNQASRASKKSTRKRSSMDAWTRDMARLPRAEWLEAIDFVIQSDTREMARQARALDINYALSNSFAFGGLNAVIALQKHS